MRVEEILLLSLCASLCASAAGAGAALPLHA